MDILNIERDFTAWVANVLNGEVDRTVFRGAIPAGMNGTAVVFGTEVPARGFYGFRPRTWDVQILSKFESRDEAQIFLAKLNSLFPRTGFTHNGTKFLSITPQGASEPYEAEDDGGIKTFVTFNILLSVLTSGTQV